MTESTRNTRLAHRAATLALANAACITAILGTAGCAADARTDPASTNPEPKPVAATAATKELARVQTASGTTITFTEVSPGNIIAEESGPTGTKPTLLGTKGGSAIEVYEALTNGQQAPAELQTAEARRITLKTEASKVPSPEIPAPPATTGHTLHPESLTPGQQWFNGTFCNAYWNGYSLAYCDYGQSAVSTPYSYTDNYQGVGYNDPTASAAAGLHYLQWMNWYGTWEFVPLWSSQPLNPNYWTSFYWWTTGLTYNIAQTSGGAGQVSVASYTQSNNVWAQYGSNLYVSGSQWPNDKTVSISAYGPHGGSASGGATVSSGGFSATIAEWCISYPTNQPATVTVKGDQTGQTKTTTVTLWNCW